MRYRYLPLVLLLPALMGADVYRYVDKDGVVTYTQQLPYGVKGELVRTGSGGSATQTVRNLDSDGQPGAAATDSANTPMKLTKEQQAMLDDLQKVEAARKEELAKIKDANCTKSRDVLQRLETRGRLRVRDEGGEERMMPEDERERRVREAQDGIVANCAPTG